MTSLPLNFIPFYPTPSFTCGEIEAQRKEMTPPIHPEFVQSLDLAKPFPLYLGRKGRGIQGERMVPFVCFPASRNNFLASAAPPLS